MELMNFKVNFKLTDEIAIFVFISNENCENKKQIFKN